MNDSFNGAMPFQAWICANAAVGRESKLKLQWGHALSGMDIELLADGQAVGTFASMGPCPFRHGYWQCWVSGQVKTSTLQWGHALSGMDIA